MTITAKQLIRFLKKCHPEAIVFILDRDKEQSILNEDERRKIHFVEFCPISNTIYLQSEMPWLADTDALYVEVLEHEEVNFAKTKYHDRDGVAY